MSFLPVKMSAVPYWKPVKWELTRGEVRRITYDAMLSADCKPPFGIYGSVSHCGKSASDEYVT